MYKFHTGGNRLFMSGGRQTDEYDSVRERESVPELAQVVTSRRMASDIHQSTSEMQRSERQGGMKSVSMRVIKKTTTLSRGQQKSRMETMMEQHDGRMIVPVREQPAIQHTSHLTQSSNYQQRQVREMLSLVRDGGIVLGTMVVGYTRSSRSPRPEKVMSRGEERKDG